MTGLAAAALVLALAVSPAHVVPLRVAAGLGIPVLVLGLAGVAFRSVPVTSAAVIVALGGYGLALAVTAAPADVVAGLIFGSLAFLLLALVDLSARTRGATRGRGVVAAWLRRVLAVVAASAAAVLVLGVSAGTLAALVPSAGTPAVVVLGALGALVAAAGLLALIAPLRGARAPAPAAPGPTEAPG